MICLQIKEPLYRSVKKVTLYICGRRGVDYVQSKTFTLMKRLNQSNICANGMEFKFNRHTATLISGYCD